VHITCQRVMDRDNCDSTPSEPISLQAHGGNDDY
jgi:hypothetical protein